MLLTTTGTVDTLTLNDLLLLILPNVPKISTNPIIVEEFIFRTLFGVVEFMFATRLDGSSVKDNVKLGLVDMSLVALLLNRNVAVITACSQRVVLAIGYNVIV